MWNLFKISLITIGIIFFLISLYWTLAFIIIVISLVGLIILLSKINKKDDEEPLI